MTRPVLFAWLLSLCAAGCAESTPPEQVGGESNWLESCDSDSDCAVGSCWCGVCTAACDDSDACRERGGGDCFDPTLPALAECRPKKRLCLETCTDSGDCSNGQRCTDGTCVGDTQAEVGGDSERDAAPDDDAGPSDDDTANEDDDAAVANGGDTAADDDSDDNTGADDDPREPPPLPACALPPTSQIPLLTHAQYDRTLRDLLGLSAIDDAGGSPPSSLLAPEHEGELTAEDWTRYQDAAVAVATRVLSTPELRSNFISCAPDDDAECLRRTVTEFGRRVFRRPLLDEEIAGFLGIADENEETDADADAEAILATFLISPSFLLRAEVSEQLDAEGAFTLSSHEIAQRLSYMLWGTLPDQELDRVADSGELGSAADIRVQAERMLADPKAVEIVVGFHRAYLLMDDDSRWNQVNRDSAVFPEFSADLVPLLHLETERFFDDVIFAEQGSFKDLFSSNVGFVNAVTAPLYGLNGEDYGEELTRVEFQSEPRPGVFSRAGFLTAFAYSTRTAPVLRGAFLARSVLGTDTGPSDPEAAETPLPAGSEFDTNRELTEAMTEPPSCRGCHQYIDPLGFALESYDALGRWQEAEANTGAAIDTEVDVIIDETMVHVTGPSELMEAIASSQSARLEYARQWLNHAYGRNGFPVDACTGPALGERLADENYRVLDLLVDLTQTPAFQSRVLDTAE